MKNIEIKIVRIAYGGAGVGYLPDGRICFVHGTAPDETVSVEIVTEKKNFVTARLNEVLSPSPDRIEVKSPVPGTVFMHLSYEAENRIKAALLKDFILRNVPQMGNTCAFAAPLIPPCPLGYRNKITLHAQTQDGKTVLGYFMDDNCTVQDIPFCPLADSAIAERLTALRADDAFMNSLADGDTLTIRHAANGVFHWKNHDIAAVPLLEFNTPSGVMKTAPESFFQINSDGAALMQNRITEMFSELPELPKVFLDLYCGAGFFALAAARAGIRSIIGADIDTAAADAAAGNLYANDFQHARFFSAPLKRIVAKLIRQGGSAPLLLVDPPRQGLDGKTICKIAGSSSVKNMIYVSCAPDTLTRDLKILSGAGFKIISTQMLNMFPRTAHLESITWVRRP
ncbi:MAG: 50S ribosomal protein L11 methyltransferase [Victivallaceae bacterium]|nr:50S ribosomal protein L11 methyltransferase [Victivallaceae bacterium]